MYGKALKTLLLSRVGAEESRISNVNRNDVNPPVADPDPISPDLKLIKIFFGLEMMECRGGRRRGGAAKAKAAQYQKKGQFAEYQEETTTTTSWAEIEREESEKEVEGEEIVVIRQARDVRNPYLKKRHYDEVVVAELREG